MATVEELRSLCDDMWNAIPSDKADDDEVTPEVLDKVQSVAREMLQRVQDD